jgi:hypothetical protein
MTSLCFRLYLHTCYIACPDFLLANLILTGERDKQRVESFEWFCAIRHFVHYFR